MSSRCEECCKCGKQLLSDEIAIHKKLVNRGATSFMCIHCLCDYFKVDEKLVLEKIEHYKMNGCLLFSKG